MSWGVVNVKVVAFRGRHSQGRRNRKKNNNNNNNHNISNNYHNTNANDNTTNYNTNNIGYTIRIALTNCLPQQDAKMLSPLYLHMLWEGPAEGQCFIIVGVK